MLLFDTHAYGVIKIALCYKKDHYLQKYEPTFGKYNLLTAGEDEHDFSF